MEVRKKVRLLLWMVLKEEMKPILAELWGFLERIELAAGLEREIGRIHKVVNRKHAPEARDLSVLNFVGVRPQAFLEVALRQVRKSNLG